VTNLWEDRALPLLVALTRSDDQQLRDGILMLGHGQGTFLGLDLADELILMTVLQLGDLGYVEYNNVELEGGSGAIITGLHVSGRGLQLLGQWPRFRALVTPATLAAAIEHLANYASPEEATVLRRAAAAVRRMGAAGLKSAAIHIGIQAARGFIGF
jgi:hypothetical protein